MLPNDGQAGLYLSPIPEPPGDPAALAAAARTYTAGQGEIDRNRAALTAAAGQVGPAWQGVGATGYQSVSTDLAATYALTSRGLAQGANALRSFSADLAAAKETTKQANAAVSQSNANATAMLDAQTTALQAQAAADNAAQSASDAESLAAATPHSASARVAAVSARSAADDAQSTASSAANRLSLLSGQFDADHARAVSLIAEAQAQAHRASTTAAAGFDAATAACMGDRPHAPRGGATGVLGSPGWLKLTDNINTWATAVGAGWTGFSGFKFMQAARTYFTSVDELEEASTAAKTAYDGFYGVSITQRTQGYFDMMAKQRAMEGAQAEQVSAQGELEDSLAGTEDLVGKLGVGMYGVAIVSDIYTEFRPSDAFGSTGEILDRVSSGLNLAASGLALGDAAEIGIASTLMAVPGVDVVVGAVLVGTALYATGEIVWQHYGHAITHFVSHATHDVEHFVSHTAHDAEHLADDVGSFLGL
jgi:uncharacterized protein YukE